MANSKSIDVKLTPDQSGNFDLSIKDGDFESVEGLDTSIYVSLFSDDRAPSYNVVESFKRRGWIGNIVSPKLPMSFLWLLDQSRVTQQTLNDAKLYAQSALQWLLTNQIAKDIAIDVSRESRGIALNIKFTGFTDEVNRFYVLWLRTAK
jgi:phage gp46-like protein